VGEGTLPRSMRLRPLVELLGSWNASCLEVPAGGDAAGMVPRVHFREDRGEVMRLLEAEMPFVMHGVPDVDAACARWTDEYLGSGPMAPPKTFAVTVSGSHRFMYRNPKAARGAGWGPAAGSASRTETRRMTLGEFRERGLGDLAWHDPGDVHYYLQLGAREAEWLREEMPSLQTLSFEAGATAKSRRARLKQLRQGDPGEQDAAALLQVDALDEDAFESVEGSGDRRRQERRAPDGRWATPGVVAECHLDFSRNWVAVVRGHRRYLLIPPTHCESLYVDGEPTSPLYRHSVVDLTCPDVDVFPLLGRAEAAQVVLGPGDLLFIPSYWLHYIVSLDESLQLNIRSRMAVKGKREADRCLEHGRLRARLGDPRFLAPGEFGDGGGRGAAASEFSSALAPRHLLSLSLVLTWGAVVAGTAVAGVVAVLWRAHRAFVRRGKRRLRTLPRTSPAP